MRTKFYLFILLFPVVLLNCTVTDCPYSPDEVSNDGCGILLAETRILPKFNAIHMNTAGDVFVSPGLEQSVCVTIDSNLIDCIETTVNNRVLKINVQKGRTLSDYKLTIDIVTPDLKEVITSSAGIITGKGKFSCDNITLIASSAGDISLELDAQNIYSYLSSAGCICLCGKADYHNANLSSAGNLHAFGLKTRETYTTVSSAGSAMVYATELLNVIISSIGSVYYKGHPTIYETVSSIGQLVDAN